MNSRTVYFRLAALLLAFAAFVNPAASQTIAQQAYLKASNTGAGDLFGNAAAGWGDTLVIGSVSEASNATGVNGNQSNNSAADSGAAYVFVRSGTNWVQQAYLKASNTSAGDRFGYTVAISGDTTVVGSLVGAVYVFVRTGTNWSQQAYLAAGGGAVAVSGDTLVAGAYVFVRNGTNWSQQAHLEASNAPASLGSSVSVSGDTVVIGAHVDASGATGVNGDQNDNSAPGAGAAYVFVRTGTNWTQQAYLKASNTDANDYFGSVVSVSGDTIVVGAYQEASNATGVDGDQSDNSAPYAGAAYVFVRAGTNWSQQAYLKASNAEAGDCFGLSVGVSGDTIAVSSPLESSNATGVNGNQSDNSAQYSGAAYIFVRNGTNWTQQAYLKASNTGAGDAVKANCCPYHGALAIWGDTVVVGAAGEASNATGVNGNQASNSSPDAGAAYVFTGLGKVTPRLAIAHSGGTLQLSWPTNATGFVLQSATTLANGGDWQDSLLSATETNGQKVVPLTPTGGRGFFRLHQP